MVRFLLGFLAASALWVGAGFVLHGRGMLTFESDEATDEPERPAVDHDDAPPGDPKKRRKPRRGGRSATGTGEREPSRAPLPQGNATTGDAIDFGSDRQLDMAAGEEQLSGSEIEAGFDSAMGRIRRCLVLVPAEGDVTGKLTFGMRVAGDGTPRAVNLSGPAVVTKGESGDCLRQAAQSIRFAKFDGPDMQFKYPITLQ